MTTPVVIQRDETLPVCCSPRLFCGGSTKSFNSVHEKISDAIMTLENTWKSIVEFCGAHNIVLDLLGSNFNTILMSPHLKEKLSNLVDLICEKDPALLGPWQKISSLDPVGPTVHAQESEQADVVASFLGSLNNVFMTAHTIDIISRLGKLWVEEEVFCDVHGAWLDNLKENILTILADQRQKEKLGKLVEVMCPVTTRALGGGEGEGSRLLDCWKDIASLDEVNRTGSAEEPVQVGVKAFFDCLKNVFTTARAAKDTLGGKKAVAAEAAVAAAPEDEGDDEGDDEVFAMDPF